LKLLIDNNISPHIASALNALVGPDGHQVEALRAKFPDHPSDVDWIGRLEFEGG
jgi:PIN like domain